MWIQRAYASQIEDAVQPLVCTLDSDKSPGDLIVTCNNGTRQLKFFIQMNPDPNQFSVKVSYIQVERNKSQQLKQIDPFREQLNMLANWLKLSS
jgi:hypothetical protein